MELKELQQKCASLSKEIREKRGNVATDYVSILHIVEELGEIARELYNSERKRKEFSKENLEEEFADIIMLLLEFANRKDIDVSAAIERKMDKLRLRHKL